MDVDGTLTDGKIYLGANGEVMKAFNIKDGYGIHDILTIYGITPVIITGRNSKIVENRCKELGITELFQGVHDKTECLRNFLEFHNANFSEVAYIGDDLNDLPCMKAIKTNGGIIGCPANANKHIVEITIFLSMFNGGDGAVREFIERIVG
jgi:3-deoxy-D-manno-octulosonate 8-phosphate phosphatase (KDO 8-P phosphatase)